MANQHIEITGTSSRLAGFWRELVDSARRLQDMSDKVQGIADAVRNSTPYDNAALAGLLGITEAEAATAYTQLAAFITVINKAAYDEFVDKQG
jgi:hypothetical protein